EKLEKEINEINGKIGIVKNLLDKKNIWLKRILTIGETLPSSKIYITSITPGVMSQQTQQTSQPLPQQPQEPPPPSEGQPFSSQPPSGPQPTPQKEVTIETGNVFTLIGEVVIGDIKTAFNDFKDFVDRLSKLDFIQKVEISSCEVNQEKNKIDFSLILSLK
ncbi:MAG: hypothetical protein NZ891_03300, partial [bacterium]|nr:hypothetical protein [bacterium]MDW8163751.1 hypothetical protein [Candidatus Omnitrophota bacterium]